MPPLSAIERAKLPDGAFAYIDSKGVRRLPIHDASHVRNALARFSQVRFESDADRAAARDRLLKAAKRFGIVPLGFMSRQLDSDRKRVLAAGAVVELSTIRSSGDLQAALRRSLRDRGIVVERVPSGAKPPDIGPGRMIVTSSTATLIVQHQTPLLDDPEVEQMISAAVRFVIEREHLDAQDSSRSRPTQLPTGVVTHLLTDIEASTTLLVQLGERYGTVLTATRRIVGREVAAAGGILIEARADETVSVFTDPESAVRAALAFQKAITDRRWPEGTEVRIRVGIHTGPISVVDGSYVGLSVHQAARVTAMAGGGEILVSRTSLEAIPLAAGFSFTSIGSHSLAGVPEPMELFAAVFD